MHVECNSQQMWVITLCNMLKWTQTMPYTRNTVLGFPPNLVVGSILDSKHMLVCFQIQCFTPHPFWASNPTAGSNNSIAGFVHILPSAGLYLTQHFWNATASTYSANKPNDARQTIARKWLICIAYSILVL